ncbi:uncharacterized protein LOC135477077 [Liolophura sinensis]|uniref:uncharacterized protein LOC135477077 n=1 Tax=Liolophura sinensis TaxID=3198878 RepID=UPI0031583655
MGLLRLAVLLVGVSLARGQVPIPKRPLGYVYKGVAPTAPVNIEFFLDLICPDSKAAFPVLKAVGDHYGGSVRIAAIPFPLPYHRNAFLAAKGIHVVNNLTNGDMDKVYLWMANVFQYQAKFGEALNYNLPENDTVGQFSAIATTMGLSGATFEDLLTNNSDLDFNTRIEWKYACTRGVAGTPWFTINGVPVPADASWSVSDWIKVIDPLLAQKHYTHKRSAGDGCTKRCEFLPGKVECCTPGENCIPNVGCRC